MELEQSQNILNWYNFTPEDEILEIGGNTGNLTTLLCKKVKKVTTLEPNIENVEKIKKKCEEHDNLEIVSDLSLEKQYDKVVLIGVAPRVQEFFGEYLTLEQIIKKMEKYLKSNGKILLALDNKFGIRYFSGNYENALNKKFASLNGYKNETKKIETYTKEVLENIFNKLGYNYNFYYPLPDYKIPDVIFSDKYLPTYRNFDKYNSYFIKDTFIVFDEIVVLREILKTNPEMFTFFANSFFIEISKNETSNQYKYISFCNMRKEQYRMITKISDDVVEKETANEKAQNHYEEMKNNLKIMQDSGTKTLDYIEDGKIKSKYINQELMLSNVLEQKLKEENYQEFYELIDKYIQELSKNTYKETDFEKTVFNKYGVEIEDKEIIKELNFLKDGLWDMTLTNCFYVDGEFYFFDQEWNETNMPYEYILYKSIMYTQTIKSYINTEVLFEKYNLKKYLKIFQELDNKIQDKIRDNEVFAVYNRINVMDIDATVQEMENLRIREDAQEKIVAKYYNNIFRKIYRKLFGGK